MVHWDIVAFSIDNRSSLLIFERVKCESSGYARTERLKRKISMELTTKNKILACILILTALVVPAGADPAIWHLTDEDSDIYIFGTVHILPPELEWRSPEIADAFANAETIWFEAPAVDPDAQTQVIQLVTQYGLNEPGNPLSAQLSEEAQALLNEIVSGIGIGAASLEPMRPWLAAMTVSVSYIQSQGYEATSGVEYVLWGEASEAGKQIAYFETLEQQVRFLADLPPEIEVAYLEQMLQDFEGAGDELDQLVTAWETGDIATIDAVMNGDTRMAAPEVHETLLVGRNLNWIQTIKETLAGSGSHFMAIGAAHIAGPEGVVELLRSEGFEIAGP